MSEPPIFPPDGSSDERSPIGNATDEPLVNPYAPTTTDPAPAAFNRGETFLPMQYWASVGMCLLIFGVLAFLAPGLGVPALLALIAAAVRVPLLQRRLSRTRQLSSLPQPLLLLLTSWGLMLAAGFASIIAFCMICIPSGIAVFSIDSRADAMIGVVFGVSGLVGLAAFVFLFRLSLRMSV